MNETAPTAPPVDINAVLPALLQVWLVAQELSAVLTPTEMKELTNICLGTCVRAVAIRESVKVETVRTRRKRIYRKLDRAGSADITGEFLRWAIAQGRLA